MTAPDQFISPEQWGAIKATVVALNNAEADGDTDLHEWFFDLRDHLTQLLVASSPPVEPMPITEHFAWLLDMFVAGSQIQETVAEGSQLVVDWARQTLQSCSLMGIQPKRDGEDCVWLGVYSVKDINE